MSSCLSFFDLHCSSTLSLYFLRGLFEIFSYCEIFLVELADNLFDATRRRRLSSFKFLISPVEDIVERLLTELLHGCSLYSDDVEDVSDRDQTSESKEHCELRVIAFLVSGQRFEWVNESDVSEKVGEYVELDSESAKEDEDESSNGDESQDREEQHERDVEYASFEHHRPHGEENDEGYA